MATQDEKRIIGRHACERCRRAKTRCLIDTLEKYGKCRKCHAADLQCEWKEISTKRRRKRTDARVTELEKQIQSLETALSSRQGRQRTSLSPPNHAESTASSLPIPEASHESAANSVQRLAQRPTHSILKPTEHETPEMQYYAMVHDADESVSTVIDDRVLGFSARTELFNGFLEHSLPKFPVIAISPEEGLESVERSRPYVAAAMVVSASSFIRGDLFRTLHTHILRRLTDEVLLKGKKSLDLLQAILISAIWFCPPERFDRLNFYQWTHVAGTMALELGLGGRTSWQANVRAVAPLSENPSVKVMEMFRTMFGVYLSCSRLSISFGRQKIISYGPATVTALDMFSKQISSENDRNLVAWMKLQAIAEDVESMKASIESATYSSQLGRERIKDDLSLFESRFREWQRNHGQSLKDGRTPKDRYMSYLTFVLESLRIDFCFCKAKLHELAIYADQDLEDLSVPFLARSVPTRQTYRKNAIINPTYVRALLSFIADCHSVLDAFLQTDVEYIRGAPLLTIFRIAYAFKALCLLQSAQKRPEHAVSQTLDSEALQIEHYFVAASKHMEDAAAGSRYPVPAFGLAIRDATQDQSKSSSSTMKPQTATTDAYGTGRNLSPSRGSPNDLNFECSNLPDPTQQQIETCQSPSVFPSNQTAHPESMDWYMDPADDLLSFDLGLEEHLGLWPA